MVVRPEIDRVWNPVDVVEGKSPHEAYRAVCELAGISPDPTADPTAPGEISPFRMRLARGRPPSIEGALASELRSALEDSDAEVMRFAAYTASGGIAKEVWVAFSADRLRAAVLRPYPDLPGAEAIP